MKNYTLLVKTTWLRAQLTSRLGLRIIMLVKANEGLPIYRTRV
jgi:hypothetical protein